MPVSSFKTVSFSVDTSSNSKMKTLMFEEDAKGGKVRGGGGGGDKMRRQDEKNGCTHQGVYLCISAFLARYNVFSRR